MQMDVPVWVVTFELDLAVRGVQPHNDAVIEFMGPLHALYTVGKNGYSEDVWVLRIQVPLRPLPCERNRRCLVFSGGDDNAPITKSQGVALNLRTRILGWCFAGLEERRLGSKRGDEREEDCNDRKRCFQRTILSGSAGDRDEGSKEPG